MTVAVVEIMETTAIMEIMEIMATVALQNKG